MLHATPIIRVGKRKNVIRGRLLVAEKAHGAFRPSRNWVSTGQFKFEMMPSARNGSAATRQKSYRSDIRSWHKMAFCGAHQPRTKKRLKWHF